MLFVICVFLLLVNVGCFEIACWIGDCTGDPEITVGEACQDQYKATCDDGHAKLNYYNDVDCTTTELAGYKTVTTCSEYDSGPTTMYCTQTGCEGSTNNMSSFVEVGAFCFFVVFALFF